MVDFVHRTREIITYMYIIVKVKTKKGKTKNLISFVPDVSKESIKIT